jgi:hypothetical protein
MFWLSSSFPPFYHLMLWIHAITRYFLVPIAALFEITQRKPCNLNVYALLPVSLSIQVLGIHGIGHCFPDIVNVLIRTEYNKYRAARINSPEGQQDDEITNYIHGYNRLWEGERLWRASIY